MTSNLRFEARRRSVLRSAVLAVLLACMYSGAAAGDGGPPEDGLPAASAPIDKGPQAGPGTLRFSWAMRADPAGDGKDHQELITEDVTLASGSLIQFRIEPASAGVYYLIHRDPVGELSILYRERVTTGADLPGATEIPAGGSNFELDDTKGKERFFVLASAEPIGELEARIDAYEAASDAARAEHGKLVLAEIRSLNRRARASTERVERPVLIGGAVRSASAGLKAIAVEAPTGFYGKTIAVDHR